MPSTPGVRISVISVPHVASREELGRLVAGFLETEVSMEEERENMFRLQYSGLVLSLFYSVTR